MVWWGYAGFSGAIVGSVAMLATVVGLSADVILNLVAYVAGGMLALGVAVHLTVLLVQIASVPRTRPAPPKRVEPAFLRPAPVQTAASQAPLKPLAKPDQRSPGAIAVLFPQQAAQ